MRKSEIIIVTIIVISFIISIYFYPQMPEQMAIHWNFRGEVNGYSPKSFGLFFFPSLLVGLFFLFFVIPKIDPLKNNIEKFRKYYDRFVVLLIGFLQYANLLVISWNLGVRFTMIQALAPAFGILFYYAGVLCENAKTNWFIGIRTPWTLSNEKVWEKTHELGGKLFKACGIIAFFGIISEKFALYFILLPVISLAAYTVLYSYFEYQKQVK